MQIVYDSINRPWLICPHCGKKTPNWRDPDLKGNCRWCGKPKQTSFSFKIYADCYRFVSEETDQYTAIERCKALHNANPERYHEVYKKYPDGREHGIFQLKPNESSVAGKEKEDLDAVSSDAFS